MSGANPGMVGLAISYALGITGKLSGLVTSFTGSFLHTKGRQQIITNTNRDGEGAGGRGARAAICEQDPARAGEVDGGDGVRDLFNITLKGIEPKLIGSFNWCYRWRAPSPPPTIGPARASSP